MAEQNKFFHDKLSFSKVKIRQTNSPSSTNRAHSCLPPCRKMPPWRHASATSTNLTGHLLRNKRRLIRRWEATFRHTKDGLLQHTDIQADTARTPLLQLTCGETARNSIAAYPQKRRQHDVIKTKSLRYNNKQLKNIMPMKHFTQEEKKPSSRTLNIIRQIAYTYRVMKMNGQNEVYCLN